MNHQETAGLLDGDDLKFLATLVGTDPGERGVTGLFVGGDVGAVMEIT